MDRKIMFWGTNFWKNNGIKFGQLLEMNSPAIGEILFLEQPV